MIKIYQNITNQSACCCTKLDLILGKFDILIVRPTKGALTPIVIKKL